MARGAREVGAIPAQGLVAAALVVCLLSSGMSQASAEAPKEQEVEHVTLASFQRSTRYLIFAQHFLPPDQLRDQGPRVTQPREKKQDPSMTFVQLQFFSNQLRGQDSVHFHPGGRALHMTHMGFGGQGDRAFALKSGLMMDSRWSTTRSVNFSGDIGEGGTSGLPQLAQGQHPSEGFVQQQSSPTCSGPFDFDGDQAEARGCFGSVSKQVPLLSSLGLGVRNMRPIEGGEQEAYMQGKEDRSRLAAQGGFVRDMFLERVFTVALQVLGGQYPLESFVQHPLPNTSSGFSSFGSRLLVCVELQCSFLQETVDDRPVEAVEDLGYERTVSMSVVSYSLSGVRPL